MRIRTTSLALCMLLASAIAVMAKSPYRLADRKWPGDLPKLVYQLEGDLFNAQDTFVEASQLVKNGQPVTGLEEPLSIWKIRKMVKAQWKEEVGGAALMVFSRKKDPLEGYDWLYDMIKEYSPSEEAKLRNVRTLRRIFELRRSPNLEQWQSWRSTAITLIGRIRILHFLNLANGHEISVTTFPDLPFSTSGNDTP